jgi:hypothetical protein
LRAKSTTPPTRPAATRRARSPGISTPSNPTKSSCPGCHQDTRDTLRISAADHHPRPKCSLTPQEAVVSVRRPS